MTAERPAASSVPWDTIRRLRTHLESEQRYAFVDALDKLGEKACESEYADTVRDCEHKWRLYEKIGVVCRDCGADAPPGVAESVSHA